MPLPTFLLRPVFFTAASLAVLGACTRPDSPPPPVAAAAQPAATPPPAPAQASSTTAPDCEHPFGLSPRSELTYQVSDADRKATGLQVLKVASITPHAAEKKKPAYAEALLKSSLYDANNRLLRNDEYVYQCRQDTVLTDGQLLLDPDMLRAFRDRRFSYEPIHLSWPNQPTAGSLPDGRLTVQVSSPSVDIAKVTTTVSQRKLSGQPETVTVPAGTFQCYKVESRYEYATQARADIVRRSVKRVVDYYAPGIGVVRTEVSSDNGKLEQITELLKRTDSTR